MNPEPTGSAQRPTIVRHFVVLACMLMAVLLYLDRFCVGIAEPFIAQDLGLSTIQMGLFLSAFFLTYALFQVPSGWMTDRYGSRVMLVIYVLTWSLFTALMGLSYGFIMLLVMRAAYGIGQSGAYPTSASILSKWVPFSNRGTASSIVAFGGRIGGFVAPVLTAVLIVSFVPVSHSSLFEEKDVLKPDKVCFAIAPAPKDDSADAKTDPEKKRETPTAAQRIWSILDANSQTAVAEVAARYRPVAKQIKQLEREASELKKQRRFLAARDKTDEAEQLRVPITDRQKQQVAQALNAVVRSPEFYQTGAAAFNSLKLDRATESFQERVDNGETLSDDETQRFNRLLLEATFSDGVGNVYVAGWRPVMISYGLLGLFVAAVLWVILRRGPHDHPRCNDAERALIGAGRPATATSPHGETGGIPWAGMLKSGSLWMSSISQIGTNIGWMFIATWFQRYLMEVHKVGILERGTMTSIPMFMGWFGMLSGGKLTDFLVRKVGLKWGRRIPWGGSRFIAVAAFLTCPYLESPWAVTVAMGVVAFSTDLGTASGWAFCQDVGGKNVGSVLGWGNMWGNLGATVSPILLAWVFTSFGFDVMFQVCAAAFVVAGVCGLMIDATKPIPPPPDESN